MIQITFFGGPMDGRTISRLRNVTREGAEAFILDHVYRILWNSAEMRWEAHSNTVKA